MSLDVIVIGGGVSGLTTAHDLMLRGLDVAVLERQVKPGGNAISERFGGYLMEHGPSTLNASVTGATARLDALDLLAGAGELGPNVRKRYLRDGARLSGISIHPLGFFLSGYLSWRGRLAMASEILRPRRRDGAEESIFDFARRRFGAEFADKVIEPMAAGLFMGDSRALSINGAFPKLVELERRFGSITRGVLAARRGAEPGRKLYSWPGGIATIPAALSARLGGRVQCGITVRKITPRAQGFDVVTSHGTRHARAVVLAVQPHVVASLLEQIEPTAAAAARAIAAPSIGVVYLGYRRDQVAHPLDGLGFLSTKKTGQVISGAQFCSTMFAGRAPRGHVSISCYTGGARHPDLAGLSDAELSGAVRGELADILGIKGAPKVMRTRRWALGLPQYGLGHAARRQVLETTPARMNGLFVTGNFIGGVSVANCMDSASETAARVAEALQQGRFWRNSLSTVEKASSRSL